MSARPPLALVTGGHRRLGAVIAARLAKAGYRLAIHGSQDGEPEPVLADVFAENGTEWAGFAADFTDPAAPLALMASVEARFGQSPDLLVNSASIFGQDRIGDTSHATLIDHYAVNCAAPAMLIQAFAGQGHRTGRSVVNILDQRLAQPHGDQLAYSLSKHALSGLTRIAARDLAPTIRVNAVAPGLTIVTDDYDAGQTARLSARMPLQCLPQARQVADAVLFLAHADATTGQTIFVDGGAHMKSFDRDFVNLER